MLTIKDNYSDKILEFQNSNDLKGFLKIQNPSNLKKYIKQIDKINPNIKISGMGPAINITLKNSQ